MGNGLDIMHVQLSIHAMAYQMLLHSMQGKFSRSMVIYAVFAHHLFVPKVESDVDDNDEEEDEVEIEVVVALVVESHSPPSVGFALDFYH